MRQKRFLSRYFYKPSRKYLNQNDLVYCNGKYHLISYSRDSNGILFPYILTSFNESEIIEEQCVGINDKNNTLIYENDIVELDDSVDFSNAIIEWDDKTGCWNIRTSDTIYTFDNLYGNDLSIIGNVNLNKDLIEDFYNE